MRRLALVVLFAGVATAQIPAIEWDKQKAEILQHHLEQDRLSHHRAWNRTWSTCSQGSHGCKS